MEPIHWSMYAWKARDAKGSKLSPCPTFKLFYLKSEEGLSLTHWLNFSDGQRWSILYTNSNKSACQYVCMILYTARPLSPQFSGMVLGFQGEGMQIPLGINGPSPSISMYVGTKSPILLFLYIIMFANLNCLFWLYGIKQHTSLWNAVLVFVLKWKMHLVTLIFNVLPFTEQWFGKYDIFFFNIITTSEGYGNHHGSNK